MSKTINDKFTREFKKNLKKVLKSRDDTNAKRLSIEAGLGETAVRDILQNRSNSPRLDTIHRLAKALDVQIYDLIPSMIKNTYDELETLRAENYALREELESTYATMEHSLSAAKKRSNSRLKKK